MLADDEILSSIALIDDCFIHCFISEKRTILEKEGKGFEKLEYMGLAPENIESLRFHFHEMCYYSQIVSHGRDSDIEYEDKWVNGELPIMGYDINELNNHKNEILNNTGDGFDCCCACIYTSLTGCCIILCVTFI